MNEEKIVEFMKDLFSKYDKLRGNDKSSGPWPFWDVVIITTADETQRKAYQSQIDAKKEKKELPLNLDVHVISDPPGPKLGNGGSTFTALKFLKKIFGEKMFELKVLLIHAGGLSKRLPSTSILGKIF